MMLKVVYLTATFFATSLGFPVQFTASDCGSGEYKSSDVIPAIPKTGETFEVTNHFSFDRDVSEVQADIKVTALGALTLKQTTFSLCGKLTSYGVYLGLMKVADINVFGLDCPLTKGFTSVKYDIKLASILPPILGTSSFHFTAKDQAGADLFCLQATLGVEALAGKLSDQSMKAPLFTLDANGALAEVKCGKTDCGEGMHCCSPCPPYCPPEFHQPDFCVPESHPCPMGIMALASNSNSTTVPKQFLAAQTMVV